MTLLNKDQLRDELYHAIKKVLNANRSSGTLDIITTESTEILMVNAAMSVLCVIEDAQEEWKRDGYLST
jgi:hypothetical protein